MFNINIIQSWYIIVPLCPIHSQMILPFFSEQKTSHSSPVFFLPVPPVEVLQGFVQHAILGGKLGRRRRRHLKRLVLQNMTCDRLDFFHQEKKQKNTLW